MPGMSEHPGVSFFGDDAAMFRLAEILVEHPRHPRHLLGGAFLFCFVSFFFFTFDFLLGVTADVY